MAGDGVDDMRILIIVISLDAIAIPGICCREEIRKNPVVVGIAAAIELVLLMLRVKADVDRVVCADDEVCFAQRQLDRSVDGKSVGRYFSGGDREAMMEQRDGICYSLLRAVDRDGKGLGSGVEDG